MSVVAPPSEYRVGKHRIVHDKIDTTDLSDPRGIIFLYEPPNPRYKYVIGVDATQGRTGWSRFSRTEDDSKIDNGAICVLRLGRGEPGTPQFTSDAQVAEYAAPIDPYDLAKVVNFLGRLYSGRDEDGQCPCIIEVYPGPGGPCQVTLKERYGYTNFYRWQYLDTGQQTERRNDEGWYSNRQSVQHLWTRGLRYLQRRQVVLRSPYLVEELADCSMDLIKLRGQASTGHDDRVTALLLAIWYGHNWTFDVESDTTTRATAGPVVEWQATDISSDRMYESWDQRWEELVREAEQDYA